MSQRSSRVRHAINPPSSKSENDSSFSVDSSHQVEHNVQRLLMGTPQVHFSSLVVRRIQDGVCLEGFVESDAELAEADRLASQVAGVENVLNRLVVRCPAKNR